MTQTFICAGCGNEVNIKALAIECLDQADTNNRVTAIMRLPMDETLCQECADDVDVTNDFDISDLSFGEELGRTYQERFELSGLDYIDPGKLAAYLMNY